MFIQWSLFSNTFTSLHSSTYEITVHSLSLTPRSLPGQIPHADLGALPVFLVYRYTMRLPGVRDLSDMMQSVSTAFEVCIRHLRVFLVYGEDLLASMQESHSQSGLVWSSVVGKPTAVRQALHHLDLKNDDIFMSVLEMSKHVWRSGSIAEQTI